MKIILRAVQYLRLIWLRISARRRQPRDLVVELFQTAHACRTYRVLLLKLSEPPKMPEPSAESMLRLHAKAAAWNVTLEEFRETPSSLLGFGVRAGRRVVLKITKQPGDESHSGKVLRAFAGEGAVTVYESETDAVLLERLEPGEQLVNLVKRGDDEEATKILAQVIGKIGPSSGASRVSDGR